MYSTDMYFINVCCAYTCVRCCIDFVLFLQGIDVSGYHFTHNGNPIDKESSVSIEISDSEQESGVVVLRAYPGVQGGKGGELDIGEMPGFWDQYYDV